MVKAVGECVPLVDEEGEAQEAQRQEQENCIFKQEAVASKIIALIKTGIEDMMGASNGIITWNQGNMQSLVKVDNLLIKLGQDLEQLEPREEGSQRGRMTITGMGHDPATEVGLRNYQEDLQDSWIPEEEEQYPSTQEDSETGYSTGTTRMEHNEGSAGE